MCRKQNKSIYDYKTDIQCTGNKAAFPLCMVQCKNQSRISL